MIKTRRYNILWTVLIFACLVVWGCKTVQTPIHNPNTGTTTFEEKEVFDPNHPLVAGIETGAEVVGTSIGLIWPGGTAIGGVILGLLAAWRRYKPQLVAAVETSELLTATNMATVSAIEQLKTASPEAWAELKPWLKKYFDTMPIACEHTVTEVRRHPLQFELDETTDTNESTT
jgi:hypothetical protein